MYFLLIVQSAIYQLPCFCCVLYLFRIACRKFNTGTLSTAILRVASPFLMTCSSSKVYSRRHGRHTYSSSYRSAAVVSLWLLHCFHAVDVTPIPHLTAHGNSNALFNRVGYITKRTCFTSNYCAVTGGSPMHLMKLVVLKVVSVMPSLPGIVRLLRFLLPHRCRQLSTLFDLRHSNTVVPFLVTAL